MINCATCNKPIRGKKNMKVAGYKSQCRPCFSKNPPVAAQSSNWTGGITIDRRGYVYVSISGIEDPIIRDNCKKSIDNRSYGKMRSGRIYQHHVEMIKHLKRPLEKGEVVHHKNGETQNNHISNLVLLSQKDHVWDYRNLMFENKRLKELLKVNNITF